MIDGDARSRVEDYCRRHGADPAVVARRIVRAIRRSEHRVLVTPESTLFDWMRRLVPEAGNRLANRLMSRRLDVD